MSDEIPVGDRTYVSSKRASETSGYAQDYIGQLARKALIDAKRVGGLWYVDMASLESYKLKPEAVPIVAESIRVPQNDLDVLVSFDGKDYISANRASKLTGYNQDYVGQLARSGKILARQVGSRWYVDHQGLLMHKKEKDELLASVQAASVGIYAEDHKLVNDLVVNSLPDEPLLSYNSDVGDLTPAIHKPEILSSNSFEPFVTRPEHITDLKSRNKEVPIHVNKVGSKAETRVQPIRLGYAAQNIAAGPARKIAIRFSPRIIVLAGIIILLITLLFYVALQTVSNRSSQTTSLVSSMESSVSKVASGIAKRVEDAISPDLVYQRKK